MLSLVRPLERSWGELFMVLTLLAGLFTVMSSLAGPLNVLLLLASP